MGLGGWPPREKMASALAHVKELHHAYLPAAVDFDCCAHCNMIANGYVAWPCDTIQAIRREFSE